MDPAPKIGILGFGYLGQEILRSFDWSNDSWASTHHPPESSSHPERVGLIHFDWLRPETWENIPQAPSALLLTIPPVFQDIAAEKLRLQEWCQWMKHNRQNLHKLVYISTTGVYPNEAGTWSEDSTSLPDSAKGLLRWETEKILQDFFETRVIRAGAIYGKGRHIGLRLLKNKPIPQGNQPIHRIHVRDLAHISRLALTQEHFPKVLNAIDQEAVSTEHAANWLLTENLLPNADKIEIQFLDGYYTRKKQKQNPDRLVSNQKLLEEVQYHYDYPTFRQGLIQSIREENC
ncbi:MAG: hypothetical protein COB67_01285 [SAR324 cluster bacterium]|uniref:NAD(P)-dependent oxidoreductase n=1 Tax=SAR324 cluster bacterium TaxID=2024889 RepID=A0A2A4TAN9_9DELT|nr:MAG: hypothetical protein COB67_01285 [SAR324 cluster bacterium]